MTAAVPAVESPLVSLDEHPPEVMAALGVLGAEASAAGLRAATVNHVIAGLLDHLGQLRLAEAVHRRAGLLLVDMPTGGKADVHRIEWARALAANLAAQQRPADAESVLRAAAALAEGLLGPDHTQTRATLAQLAQLCQANGDRPPSDADT